jgi:putative hydrolase of the HAD superfamily
MTKRQRGSGLTEAVIFDFIGTLAEVKDHTIEEIVKKSYESLVDDGFQMDRKRFMDVFYQIYQKYRLVRYQDLVEVSNSVWIAETLNQLGFAAEPDNGAVRKAVNISFQTYFQSLKARHCASRTLKKLSGVYALGLVSNFTYTPVIYAGVRKLGFSLYFNSILISDDVGWRKPNPRIFEEALKRLNKNVDQAVFVGDNPIEDIRGAKDIGMKAIFIPSQFFTIEDAEKAPQPPDLIINSLCELPRVLPKM